MYYDFNTALFTCIKRMVSRLAIIKNAEFTTCVICMFNIVMGVKGN